MDEKQVQTLMNAFSVVMILALVVSFAVVIRAAATAH